MCKNLLKRFKKEKTPSIVVGGFYMMKGFTRKTYAILLVLDVDWGYVKYVPIDGNGRSVWLNCPRCMLESEFQRLYERTTLEKEFDTGF